MFSTVAASPRVRALAAVLATGALLASATSALAAPGDLTLINVDQSGNFVPVNYPAFRMSSDGTKMVVLGLNGQVYFKDLTTGGLTVASSDASGTPGNGTSSDPWISGDGRYVAFTSMATNLDPADANANSDTYIKDLATGSVWLAGTNSAGVRANQGSHALGVSPDGSVMFLSTSSNLDPAAPQLFCQGPPRNGHPGPLEDCTPFRVFLKRGDTGAITLLSQHYDNAVMSADGTKIAIETPDALVPEDTDGNPDIFIRDVASGAIVLASTTAPEGVDDHLASLNPGVLSLSADGHRVAFSLTGNDKTAWDPRDTGPSEQVYVKDMLDGSVTLVSVNGAGEISATASDTIVNSHDPFLSADGTQVSFASNATNLDPADTSTNSDIYLRDLATGTLALVSVDADWTNRGGDSFISQPIPAQNAVYFATPDAFDPRDASRQGGIYRKDIATPSAPGAPTNVAATAGDGNATVSWTAPGNGGRAISGYIVTSSPGGITQAAGPSATSAVVSGLTNGASYTFTVTATNVIGTGSSSLPSNAVTPQVKANQTITFAALPNRTMLQSPVTPTATASSGLPVSFSTTTPAICAAGGVNGGTITLLGAGTCTVQADQAGDGTYNPAPPRTRSFTVSRVNQTITFGALGNRTLLQTPFTVSATASSGLGVSFISSTPAVCATSGSDGSTIDLVAAGTCTIVAQQAGNATYNAAPDRTRNLTVNKANQTITFAAIPGHTTTDPSFPVTATATSGLSVTITSSTPAVCTTSGADGSGITLVGAGTCTLQADQGGNGVYNAAPAKTRSFNVKKATQTITFAALTNRPLAQSPFTVGATASSGLQVTFVSTTPAVCATSGPDGSTVTLLARGTCTLQAQQPGDGTYAAAPNVNRNFRVQ